MILTPHILLGAAIASKIPNIWGLILAFLSHFILDAIPHSEYSLKSIKRVKKGQFLKDILKVELDFGLGVIIFTFLAVNFSSIRIIYGLLGIIVTLIPDSFLFLHYISAKKRLKKFGKFNNFIHYFKRPKIALKPSFLTIFTQVLMAMLAILILRF